MKYGNDLNPFLPPRAPLILSKVIEIGILEYLVLALPDSTRDDLYTCKARAPNQSAPPTMWREK
jgi:hypothetical protein